MTNSHAVPRRLLSIFAALLLLAGPGSQMAVAATPPDVLPDLRMAPPRSFHIQRFSSGMRVLRFDALIRNVGKGRFEIKASRASTSDTTMRTQQRIYNTEGGSRYVSNAAVAKYTGDGHDHWHVQQMVTYQLYNASGGPLLRSGAKVGYFFFDTNNPVPESLYSGPRYPRYYTEPMCGTRSSLSVRMGITPGWADLYPWDFAYQYVRINDIPTGEYVLKVRVDTQNYYVEASNGNNCAYARLRISSTSTTVGVLATGYCYP